MNASRVATPTRPSRETGGRSRSARIAVSAAMLCVLASFVCSSGYGAVLADSLSREYPEEAARRLIATHPALAAFRDACGLSPIDKDLARDPAASVRPFLSSPLRRNAPRVEFVHFRQQFEGFPVLGSIVTVGCGEDGGVRTARARAFPVSGAGDSGGRKDVSGLRWISLEQARAAAIADWPADPSQAWPTAGAARFDWDLAEQAWLPEESGLRPVWRLRFRSIEPVVACQALVDGETGALVERVDLLRHGWDPASGPAALSSAPLSVFNGRILGGIEPRTAGDALVEVPFPGLIAELKGGGYSINGVTDPEGRIRIDAPTTGEYILRLGLSGEYAKVINASRGYTVPADSIAVNVPGGAEFNWTARASHVERDAYFHVTRAHEFNRMLDDGPALDAIDRPIDVIVDVPTSPTEACNAWWNGHALGFYAETQYCRSFARIADMVYHEYAHAVTQAVTGGFLTVPDDLNEAWSDYAAATLTGDPKIGLHFVGPGTFVRELETDRRWPEDANPIPHIQGLILSGALWDLRRELGPSLTDSLFHFARYGMAQSFEQYLFDLLTIDDDDGILENGTRHSGAILAAFRAHGLGLDSIRLIGQPVPDQGETAEPIVVSIEIVTPLSPLAIEESGLFMQRAGESIFTRVPLERGSDLRWGAVVALPAAGEDVRYYWQAANAAGSVARLPAGAPMESWTFRVVPDTVPPEATHIPPEVAIAGYGALPVRVEMTDDSGRIGSARCAWRFDPTGVEGEVPLARERGNTWIGLLPIDPEMAGGTLSYRIRARDRAPTPNETVIPAEGEFKVPVREGQLLDLEESDGGLTAEGDWEWGAPADSARAYSGRRVWATVLDGVYRATISSSLVWGPLALRDWDRARLQFRHLYRTEPDYDGGSVYASTNPANGWRLIPPSGGYPDYARPFGPAYGGTSEGWEEAIFPLDFYVGRTIWIRFQFDAGRAVRDIGWYLDDLALVAAQALVPPERLTAEHVGGTGVWLRWIPPEDVDRRSHRFVGYHLYRAIGEEPFTETPWRQIERTSVAYLDPTVAEGVTYRYLLRAAYDEGESEGRGIVLTPSPGQLELPTGDLSVVIRDYAVRDTIVTLRNAGTAALRFSSFVADADEEPARVRLSFPIAAQGDTEYERLAEDPAEVAADSSSSTPPDLAAIDVRQRTGEDGLWTLQIRLTGHRPWGDPRRDWGGWLFLDRDGDLSTCRRDLGPPWGQEINIGYETAVAFGALTASAGYPDEPAVLFGAAVSPFPVPLSETVLPAGADTLTLTIPLTLLSYPERLQIAVVIGRDGEASAIDQAPDLPAASWLRREPVGGTIPGERDLDLQLQMETEGLPNGLYRAALLLETTMQREAWQRLPVTLEVDRDLPAELEEIDFVSSRRELEGRFRLRREVVPDSVWVERAEGEAWVRIDEDVLVPDPDGRYTFHDSRAVTTVTSTYRIQVRQGAYERHYGPYTTTWNWQPPALEAVELASTDEGIAGTFRVPDLFEPRPAVRLARLWPAEEWRSLRIDASDPDSAGTVRFFDRWLESRPGSIRPDERYVYRVTLQFGPADSLIYEGLETVFAPPLPQTLELHPPRPNPFRNDVLFRLDLPAAGGVRLELFDVQGRRRAVLARGELPAGVHHLLWDGRDSGGEALPAGVYWVRLQGAGAVRLLRLVRVR